MAGGDAGRVGSRPMRGIATPWAPEGRKSGKECPVPVGNLDRNTRRLRVNTEFDARNNSLTIDLPPVFDYNSSARLSLTFIRQSGTATAATQTIAMVGAAAAAPPPSPTISSVQIATDPVHTWPTAAPIPVPAGTQTSVTISGAGFAPSLIGLRGPAARSGTRIRIGKAATSESKVLARKATASSSTIGGTLIVPRAAGGKSFRIFIEAISGVAEIQFQVREAPTIPEIKEIVPRSTTVGLIQEFVVTGVNLLRPAEEAPPTLVVKSVTRKKEELALPSFTIVSDTELRFSHVFTKKGRYKVIYEGESWKASRRVKVKPARS